MTKFKVGDRCTVVKNALAPKCVGDIVEITGIQSEKEGGRVLYRITIDVEDRIIDGYASEGCLELVGKETCDEVEE